jgi:hypothetical protein
MSETPRRIKLFSLDMFKTSAITASAQLQCGYIILGNTVLQKLLKCGNGTGYHVIKDVADHYGTCRGFNMEMREKSNWKYGYGSVTYVFGVP